MRLGRVALKTFLDVLDDVIHVFLMASSHISDDETVLEYQSELVGQTVAARQGIFESYFKAIQALYPSISIKAQGQISSVRKLGHKHKKVSCLNSIST